MTDRLTIQDIARLAGVSITTVSRVLNQKPDVDPATRGRILQLLDEYGFVPDFAAMRLASNQGRKSRAAVPAFPSTFFWGAATSAYQIEGAASEDGRGPCIWDAFAKEPGATHHGESGAVACDHYHHLAEDVALMGQLHLNAYRFSISWSRILPAGRGAVNERGLDFYERLVDALLAQGIAPVATLYHWDLPLALHQQGGWLSRETARAFADYAEIVTRRLGDRVGWWITLNEPWCSAYLGYGLGVHAPGVQEPQAAIDAAHHLLLAHGLAVPRIRANAQAGAQVGIALNLTPITPADDHDATRQSAERADLLHNRWLLDPLFRACYPEQMFADLGVTPPAMESDDLALIAAPLDFLGINYYSRALIRAPQPTRGRRLSADAYEYVVPVPEASYTQMAWEIYPQGLLEALARVHREYAPPLLLVTENGAAFDDQWDGRNHIPDKRRASYLSEHLQVVEEALRQGIPVGGYFVWSLLDNFEWVDGYKQRYGLIYVDYVTQRRIIKESGRWYAAFIAAQRQQEESAS
jgi:beta-glucosidase